MGTAQTLINDEQIASFANDGAVLIKGLFKPFVETAREAIEQNQANPSWRERTYRPDDGSAPFFQDYCVWSKFDGYRALVEDSPMAEIAATLMRSRTARIFHDHILVAQTCTKMITRKPCPTLTLTKPITISLAGQSNREMR